MVKDATPTNDLSNVVYIFKFHFGNDYVGRTSHRFHVRWEQHVTKKLKRFIFNGDVKPKGEQSSIHEHLLNNPSCDENYLSSRFEILFRARNSYHLSVLEWLLIRTHESKICKQRDLYNLKLYKCLFLVLLLCFFFNALLNLVSSKISTVLYVFTLINLYQK